MTGKLIEQFAIRPETGPELVGFLYQTQRRTGRRVLVRDQDGKLLFDSDDAYDLGNEKHALPIAGL